MHGDDLKGLLLSLLLICAFWAISFFIKKKNLFGSLSGEIARKTVHIGVSNFAFIYLYVFKTWIWPFAGILFFGLVNFIIEIRKDGKHKWGTVEYPLIIAFLVLLAHLGIGKPADVALALLGMGYGDGFAAVVGMTAGAAVLPGTDRKTVVGSIAMLLIVFLLCRFFAACSVLLSILTAFAATATEAYTPFNLDNISVPVVIFAVSGLINV